MAILLLVTACGPSSDPESPPPPTPGGTTAPAPPPRASAPVRPAPVQGQRAALRAVTLELSSATLLPDRLELRVVFRNTSASSFGLGGDVGAGDFRLAEAGGGELAPLDFEPGLERIDGGNGLSPGESNGGAVSFPRPVGDLFELRVPGFPPLELGWQHIGEGSGERAPLENPEPEQLLQEPGEEVPLVDLSRPGPRRELDALLAEQAAAIESYDLDRYLATFTADCRDDERLVFQRLRPLPLTAVAQRVEELLAGDGDRRRARVELRFAFDGLPDDNPFVHTLDVGFARTGGVWRVASIGENGPSRPDGPPVPWRRSELAVQRSHHFLIVTEPRMDGELVELAADAEAAYASLYHRGLPLAPGYAIYFVASLDTFQRLAGHPQVLGVALARYRTDGDRTSVDSRAFYVNGPLFTGTAGVRYPAAARRATVTHELVHLALADDTRPTTPPWLKEGAAVYFSGDLSFDADRELVRRGLDRLDLERMTRAPLGRHDTVGRQAADEYLFAGSTVAWLIAEHGQQAFLDFYRSFAERPPGELLGAAAVTALARPAALSELLGDARGALAVELADEALDRHFDLSLAELESAVKDGLRVLHG